MKRPWMPLYVADYLAKTSHLTAAESGAYLHLLMYYWTHGGLPSDEEAVARISRLNSRAWVKSRIHIKSFFDDQWKNKRLDEELAKAIEISNTNSANAKRAHSEKRANANTLHTSHSQRKNGREFLKGRKDGFKASPSTPEFQAWLHWAETNSKSILTRELKQRELEGRSFDFDAQWPPQIQ